MRTPARRSLFKYLLCLIIGLIIVSPLIYAAMAASMTAAELGEYPPRFLPSSFRLDNYLHTLDAMPMFTFLRNSFIVCLIVIVAQVITCSFAAYAFSYFKFRGRGLLFMLVLSTMMIPSEATIISNFLTITQLHLTDTYLGLVFPYLTSAMGIFLMRQFYLTVPLEIKEASVIDSCSDMRFLFSVLMPISTPIVASLSVYVFINTYNQFMWPLLVTNQMNMRTIQIGMSMLREAEAVRYENVLAGAVLVLIPSVFVFIVGQRYLVKGMTAGAVKG